MRVSKKIIELLSNFVPSLSYETGGILGSNGNEVVDEIAIDKPKNFGMKACSYSPNIDYLNDIIEQWQDRNIEFVGIFHSHFGNACKLSNNDVEYIHRIMHAMPHQIERLYFPVFVLPCKKMISYKAVRFDNVIIIQDDELILE